MCGVLKFVSQQSRQLARLKVCAALIAVLLAVAAGRHALGVVGLAEWEMKTPGGHLISHADPLKARFGTCLRRLEAGGDGVAGIYVDHLEWWTFYQDYVVGKGRGGYFVFDELRGRVDFYSSEQDLVRQVQSLGLGTPTSRRLTPEDGWREAWMPVYRDACQRLNAGAAPAGVDQATQQQLKDVCAGLGFK
jgi:hypothetical protein